MAAAATTPGLARAPPNQFPRDAQSPSAVAASQPSLFAPLPPPQLSPPHPLSASSSSQSIRSSPTVDDSGASSLSSSSATAAHHHLLQQLPHHSHSQSHSHPLHHPPLQHSHPHHSRPVAARRSFSAPQPPAPPTPAGHSNSTSTSSSSSNGVGSMPANRPQQHGQPGIPAGSGMPPFDASRSPPNTKNLNHVPCKFFRQGQCQAGKACPFSHSQEPGAELAPCKYFSKGNCKFGQKCALAHILPDGRRVNYPRPHHGGGGHIQFPRMDTNHTSHRSALHNSLIAANHLGNHASAPANHPHHSPNHSLGGQEDFPALPAQPIPSIPYLDTSSPLPDSQFGSPRNADPFAASSPMAASTQSDRTLGPLDVSLPASIDRHDYSHYAKFGPFASSVPVSHKFGIDSPPPSLPKNGVRGDPATSVQQLRRSVFPEDDSGSELSRSARNGEPESFGERMMFSAMRHHGPRYPNSYAGPTSMFNGFSKERERADPADELFEEELLPESLSELLSPAERNRRMSRTEEETSNSFRLSFTVPSTPGDPHLNSPPVGSPGSWGPIITRQKREEEHVPVSGFGHVGSPLRNNMYLNSDLHPEEASPIRGFQRSISSDMSPFTNSAPRGAGISQLTLSLKHTSLSSDAVPQTNGEGGPAISVPAPSTTIAPGVPIVPALPLPKTNPFGALNGRPIERTISSPRLGNGTGKPVPPIDEEPECQFSLEVDEDGMSKQEGGFNTSGSTGNGQQATAVPGSSASAASRPNAGLGLDVGGQSYFGTSTSTAVAPSGTNAHQKP